MKMTAPVTAPRSISRNGQPDPQGQSREAPGATAASQQPTDEQEPKEAKCVTLNADVGDSAVFQRDSAGPVGTIGPLLPSGFMPVQWGAITYLASGLSTREVAKRCGVSPNTVAKWLQMPRFLRAVEEATQRHVGRVHDLLLEGEVRASQTLLAALDAMAPVKSGSKAPSRCRVQLSR